MALPNALYAQSGGVTAVINATACAVIETARKHRNRIGNVYAGRDGIRRRTATRHFQPEHFSPFASESGQSLPYISLF